ncbi:MAG TPA: 3-hydroxyacyl-CoA dehydrogenase NAD-binding domain-containing protein [Candidatus Baltobacteraceae bacterium]|jgi:3-hydroxyacyl-CoA dehydrogenase
MGLLTQARRDGVRVVTLTNPPINALGFALSGELVAAFDAAESDASIVAIIITGSNGPFSGGADINDFLRRPPADSKSVRDVIGRIERGTKTYIAAIDGIALGGGFELALGCDYRVGTARAKIGLPEIKLGLIPGAGGTQRLPRLIGAQSALEIMLKGDLIDAARARELGIFDALAEGDLIETAMQFARSPRKRISARRAELGAKGGLFAGPFALALAHKSVPSEERGGFAAHKLIDAVEAALEFDFQRGLAREFRLFDELVDSAEAHALMHVFFAERELGKIPGLPAAQPLEIKTAAVIGGGTMGTGIGLTFASAGIPVTIVEPSGEQIERSKQTVLDTFAYQVKRGRMTEEEAKLRTASIDFERDLSAVKNADIVVEAVFENMDVKKEVFAKLDSLAKPGAILASNTSTLDIDTMAAQTKRPEYVIGTHFFAPANIMKLLEIVRGKTASPQTITTAMALGKKLRKVGVLSGNAFGFIGNRMFFDYSREAIALAEEGVPPHRVDAVMKKFGMAMGPFATFDLSGIDVFWRIQQDRKDAVGRRTNIIDRLYQLGRYGQKTGAGIYKYEKGQREPIPDPEVENIFAEEAKAAGIAPRAVNDEEIVKRLVYALVNVGAELLRTGIALRAGDEDIVYIYGYGFPPRTGGPMWYADQAGIAKVYADIKGFGWEGSPLLAELAQSGGKLADHRPTSKELAHA